MLRLASITTLAIFATTVIGCHDDDDDNGDSSPATGVVVVDFQSIADYLNNGVVLNILRHLTRHTGSSAPAIDGRYDTFGTVTATSVPGSFAGQDVEAILCFGPAAGSRLDVSVEDASVVDGGAASFIEGQGNFFTVFTAFKSVQTLDGSTCEIHLVNVYSGEVNADGSISNLFIGEGIVGIVGFCDGLAVGQIQISRNTGERLGDDCGPLPGNGPSDPDNVLVVVDNNLVTGADIFLGSDVVPVLELDALTVGVFETPPGFDLQFESVQPVAFDDGGNEFFMGEIISGAFGLDTTPAGEVSFFTLRNDIVEGEEFFAPLPVNRTNREIFAIANAGTGVELDCNCLLPADSNPLDPFIIGYYFQRLAGVITPDQASVTFFDVNFPAGPAVADFLGPFSLHPDSGAVVLTVQELGGLE